MLVGLYFDHLLLKSREGKLVGRDEPDDVVVLEDYVAVGIYNALPVTLDGYDHGVVFGSQGRSSYWQAAEWATSLDMIAIHVHFVVRVVVYQHVSFFLDVGAYGTDLVFGTYDCENVGWHQNLVFAGHIYDFLSTLYCDDVGTIAFAQLVLCKGLACQWRRSGHTYAFHCKFVFHSFGDVEGGLCLTGVEVLGEAFFDAAVETVGLTGEEHHGDDNDGQHHKETNGNVNIACYYGTNSKECHEVA